MKTGVVVIGSFNQDLTWNCAEFPAPGATIVGSFTTGPGGKGSNQAVASARAGARTTFAGALGRDAFGREAARFLRAEGLAVRIAWKKLQTGNAAILVNRAGQNQIIVALGANTVLTPRDVPTSLLRGARVVVCQHETNLRTNTAVLHRARRLGATTVLNPAPMRADFDPAVLVDIDVLIPNENEFAELVARLPQCHAFLRTRTATAGKNFGAVALNLFSPTELQTVCRTIGVPAVIVTLGKRGCFVSQHARGDFIAAHSVKTIDTTGAGDAFVGAFAAGLVSFDGDTLAAARFANAAAALSVTRRGTAPSMPHLAKIRALLRRSSSTARARR